MFIKPLFEVIGILIKSIIDSIKFLWSKRIGKIRILVYVLILGAGIFIIGYNTEKLSTRYETLGVFIVLVWIATVAAKVFIPEDNFKETLTEYTKEFPKNIAVLVKKFREEGEKKNLGCFLGVKTNGKPVYLLVEQRNGHILVLGTTGSGKTTGVNLKVLKDDIKNGRPAIIIDAKGDINNIKTITKLVEDANRQKDFQTFIITDIEHSCSYNPLEIGDQTQLADKIISAMDWPQKETPAVYYEGKCKETLEILFNEHKRNNEGTPTFSRVYQILQKPDRNKYPELAAWLKKDSNSKDISSLTTELSKFILSTFHILFEPTEKKEDEINFLEGYKNNKIIYFALDTQSYPEAATKLGKMITADLNTLSGIIQSKMNDKERHPIGIFIDEFHFFGTELFINCLSRGRASGFMILISHTSIRDLDKIGGPAYRAQIMQNTNTKIGLKMNELESATALSDSLGVCRRIEKTLQTPIDKIFHGLRMLIEKVVDKKIIPPQIFLELKTHEAVYIHGKDSGKILLDPVFIDLETAPYPKKIDRKNKDNPPHPENPPPPKSVF